MINAKSAYNIALQVLREPVEEQIRTAVEQGKFLVYIPELHTELAKYFRELGYNVKWGNSKDAFIDWYNK